MHWTFIQQKNSDISGLVIPDNRSILDKIFGPYSTKKSKFPRIYRISDISNKFRCPQGYDISEFYYNSGDCPGDQHENDGWQHDEADVTTFLDVIFR